MLRSKVVPPDPLAPTGATFCPSPRRTETSSSRDPSVRQLEAHAGAAHGATVGAATGRGPSHSPSGPLTGMTTSFLRRMEGIAQAKKRGVHTGRKKALSQEQVIDIRDRINAGETKAALARQYGISRETLYQHLRTN